MTELSFSSSVHVVADDTIQVYIGTTDRQYDEDYLTIDFVNQEGVSVLEVQIKANDILVLNPVKE